jgi:hypothetical protein
LRLSARTSDINGAIGDNLSSDMFTSPSTHVSLFIPTAVI